jgi:hypothetical protein
MEIASQVDGSYLCPLIHPEASIYGEGVMLLSRALEHHIVDLIHSSVSRGES